MPIVSSPTHSGDRPTASPHRIPVHAMVTIMTKSVSQPDSAAHLSRPADDVLATRHRTVGEQRGQDADGTGHLSPPPAACVTSRASSSTLLGSGEGGGEPVQGERLAAPAAGAEHGGDQ